MIFKSGPTVRKTSIRQLYTLVAYWQWCNRQRDQGFGDLLGKERRGITANGEEKKRRKIVKWKVENFKWKGEKYENHWNLFGSTKMEISTRKKYFMLGKNQQKWLPTPLPPPPPKKERYSSYITACWVRRASIYYFHLTLHECWTTLES